MHEGDIDLFSHKLVLRLAMRSVGLRFAEGDGRD